MPPNPWADGWSRLVLTRWRATGPHFLGLWPSWPTPRLGSRKSQKPMRLSPVMCFDCKGFPVRTQCCRGLAWRLRFLLILMGEDNLGPFGPQVGMSCKALVSGQRGTRSIAPMSKRTFLGHQKCCNSVGVQSVRKLPDRQSRAFEFGFCWLCWRCWLPNGGCGADLDSASRQLAVLQPRRVDRSISQTPSTVGFIQRPATLEPPHL